MDKLPECVVEHLYDYSIGDITYWKKQFNEVLKDIDLYVNHHHLYCNKVFGKVVKYNFVIKHIKY